MGALNLLLHLSNNSLPPLLNYINTKLLEKFDGSCLNEKKLISTCKEAMNIYIVCEINLWTFNVGKDFVLGNFLFGAAKLIKDADPDKYEFSSYV